MRANPSDTKSSTELNCAEYNDFVSSLSRTLAAANRFLVEHLKANGLTNLVPSHGDILICLFEGEPITMQQLASRINRDPSTVTSLVNKLVNAGYAQIRKSSVDRRVTEVTLTEKGATLRSIFDKITTKLVETQMRGINAKDFAITSRVLHQIKDNFLEALDSDEKPM